MKPDHIESPHERLARLERELARAEALVEDLRRQCVVLGQLITKNHEKYVLKGVYRGTNS